MKFSKYSAIYRNDNLTINDEEIIGKVKDVKEYLRYELASQCMSDVEYENFIDNGRLILDFIERLEINDEDNENKIIVRVHPMGGFYYDDYEEEEYE